GPATATVRIAYGEDEVTVQVDDDGRGPSARQQSPSGNGIVGMRERAAALGGQLYAGARPGGGFQGRARLPRSHARWSRFSWPTIRSWSGPGSAPCWMPKMTSK